MSSNHVHTCPDCDTDYPGDGIVTEVSENEYACDCLRKGRCATCEPSCGLCEEQGVYTKATTMNAHDEHRCDNCLSRESESAYERMCEDFHGGSGPQSDRERFDVDSMRGRR